MGNCAQTPGEAIDCRSATAYEKLTSKKRTGVHCRFARFRLDAGRRYRRLHPDGTIDREQFRSRFGRELGRRWGNGKVEIGYFVPVTLGRGQPLFVGAVASASQAPFPGEQSFAIGCRYNTGEGNICGKSSQLSAGPIARMADDGWTLEVNRNLHRWARPTQTLLSMGPARRAAWGAWLQKNSSRTQLAGGRAGLAF